MDNRAAVEVDTSGAKIGPVLRRSVELHATGGCINAGDFPLPIRPFAIDRALLRADHTLHVDLTSENLGNRVRSAPRR